MRFSPPPYKTISISLSDNGGKLRADVEIPVVLDDTGNGKTLPEQGQELRNALIEGAETLAGRSMNSVRVRYTGVEQTVRRRVQ